MNLNNLSISASSCDQAVWAPAVTLSLPRQKTNFFLELSKPRCNLMRGRFLRVSIWELFASFSNYTFLKLTITSAFFSTSVVSPLPTPHLLCYQLPASDMTNGCHMDTFSCRKAQENQKQYIETMSSLGPHSLIIKCLYSNKLWSFGWSFLEITSNVFIISTNDMIMNVPLKIITRTRSCRERWPKPF